MVTVAVLRDTQDDQASSELAILTDALRAFVDAGTDREELVRRVSERLSTLLAVACSVCLFEQGGDQWWKAAPGVVTPDRNDPTLRSALEVGRAVRSTMPSTTGGDAESAVLVPLHAVSGA